MGTREPGINGRAGIVARARGPRTRRWPDRWNLAVWHCLAWQAKADDPAQPRGSIPPGPCRGSGAATGLAVLDMRTWVVRGAGGRPQRLGIAALDLLDSGLEVKPALDCFGRALPEARAEVSAVQKMHCMRRQLMDCPHGGQESLCAILHYFRDAADGGGDDGLGEGHGFQEGQG